MTKTPAFRLGDLAACTECSGEFARTHSKQKFCSPKCSAAVAKRRDLARPSRNNDTAAKLWREKNALKLLKYRREHYQRNKAEIAEKQKVRRAALPREVVLERRARYSEQSCEREKRRYHASRAFLPWLNSLRGAAARAKAKNIVFDLTREWVEARWTGRCEVTGIEFVLSEARNPYLYSPSLDRIDPTRGYEQGNCRFVLHGVNALKGRGTDTDMFRIAKAIIDSRISPSS